MRGLAPVWVSTIAINARTEKTFFHMPR
jgi:hypothetical protein